MTLLSREEIAGMSVSVARARLAEYTDLLRVTLAVQGKLEDRVRDLAGLVDAEKQGAFFTKEQVAEMRRRMYGDSSERRAGETPGPLFNAGAEGSEGDEASGADDDDSGSVAKTKKKRTQFGRKPQPELPRVQVLITLPEEEMKAQGLKPWEGQFETSDVITVIPTRIVIEEQRRQKYLATPERDPALPPIVTAPAAGLKTKEGSRYSLEFDIEVAVAKYEYHLPLDRQVRMMASQGLAIESQTLYSRIDTLAWYLETAVIPRLIEEAKSSRVKLADETTWKNLGKRPECGKNKRFYLWAVRGGRAVCFSVFDGRSGKIAKSFLEGIEGFLVVDGFRGYDCLAGPKLIIARDWVHARRKFIAAEKSHPKEAAWFIAEMKCLFDIEDELKGRPLDEIRSVRQERSRPIVERIEAMRDDLSARTLPESALGKALGYLKDYWAGLVVFLSHPEVPIHTNTIEGVIRGPVVGRKNHYGSKNLKSANVAAVFYSIIETCKHHGVDARRYLFQAMRAILTEKPKGEARVPVPMPWDLAESGVSETVVSGTAPGLTRNPPENEPIPASESIS